MREQRLYDDLAWLWPLWETPAEYEPYARHVTELIRRHGAISARTLLDIGCGGGKNLLNLSRKFEATGLDISPTMLEQARALNPDCELVRADMREFSMDRCFDAILMDDAIAYMTTREDLGRALACAYRHLREGGVMVVTPDGFREDCPPERTRIQHGSGTIDGRHYEVSFVMDEYDPDPADDRFETTMVYLIREDGRLRVETDLHHCGWFDIETWRATLRAAGFAVAEAPYLDRGQTYHTFACLKPTTA